MIPLIFFFSKYLETLLASASLVFLFISTVLLIFLNMASHESSKTFSENFLLKVAGTNESLYRIGYFSICESKNAGNSSTAASRLVNNASSMVCGPIEKFKADNNLAYDFAKRVVRPYFLVIATIVTMAALLISLACVVVPARKMARGHDTLLVVTSIALFCTLVGACWQQVAVQAAVVLVPRTVIRGHRAAGMIWSAVAMLLLTVFSETTLVYYKEEPEEEQDEDSIKIEKVSMDSSVYEPASFRYK